MRVNALDAIRSAGFTHGQSELGSSNCAKHTRACWGHADTRITAHHYAHLCDKTLANAVNRFLPNFGATPAGKVAPLKNKSIFQDSIFLNSKPSREMIPNSSFKIASFGRWTPQKRGTFYLGRWAS